MSNTDVSPAPGAEKRLQELGLTLPPPPEPYGAYVMAVQTGSLLFLTGMLATEGRRPAFTGAVGVELDIEAGRMAARIAALNALAVARRRLGTLDRISQVVRLGVSIVSPSSFAEHPRVADGASELLRDVLGTHMMPCRVVYGVASLPLGSPVELELIFEVVD